MAKKALFAKVDDFTPDMRLGLYSLLEDWNKISKQLVELSDQEKKIRKQIADVYFKGAGEGANTIDVGFDMELVCDVKINRTVDVEQYDAARNDPDPSLQLILNSVVENKPSIRVGGWKELSANERGRLSAVVTEKDGLPGLKLRPKS